MAQGVKKTMAGKSVAVRAKSPASIPALGSEDGLNRYLAEIKKFPLLAPEEEFMLAKRFQTHGDPDAAAKLVTSHLRLVAKIAIVEEGRGKRAVTHWRLLEALRSAALVECRLETGRTHQIRVHMASIGHAIVGDPVYGRPRDGHQALLRELGFARQALHAGFLGFIHPISGALLNFESPIPSDMQQLLIRTRV